MEKVFFKFQQQKKKITKFRTIEMGDSSSVNKWEFAIHNLSLNKKSSKL